MVVPEHKHIRYWDRVAPNYDNASGFIEHRLFAPCRPWVGTRASGDVLEVCVGTGLNFPEYGVDVRLTGVDWSESMLDQARARARDLDFDVALQRGDAMALPFADASFDSVVCTFGLCCVPDDKLAIEEMLRVLKPGGNLLLADHVRSSVFPLRLLQNLLDIVLVRTQGEYLTRRPSRHLESMPVAIVESERTSMGIIERVHAQKQ